MASTIYSAQFDVQHALAGSGPVLVVPAGDIFVIRDLEMSVGATLGTELFLLVDLAVVVGFQTGVTTERTWYHWDGRIVVNAGQGLSVGSDGVADWVLSGYVLTAP